MKLIQLEKSKEKIEEPIPKYEAEKPIEYKEHTLKSEINTSDDVAPHDKHIIIGQERR